MNFPLRTAFASSHRFYMVPFSLSFASRYFKISSLISLLIYLFFSSMFSLHVSFFFLVSFSVVDFLFNTIVIRKDARNNFYTVKFFEACFVA